MTVTKVKPTSEELELYRKAITSHAAELFERLESLGNKRDHVQESIAFLLERMDKVIQDNIDHIGAQDAAEFNHAMVIVLVAVRVVMRNPMYETPALTLQFTEELRSMLADVSGLILEDDDDQT